MGSWLLHPSIGPSIHHSPINPQINRVVLSARHWNKLPNKFRHGSCSQFLETGINQRINKCVYLQLKSDACGKDGGPHNKKMAAMDLWGRGAPLRICCLRQKETKELSRYRTGKRLSSLFKVAPHSHKYLLNESETAGEILRKQANKQKIQKDECRLCLRGELTQLCTQPESKVLSFQDPMEGQIFAVFV